MTIAKFCTFFVSLNQKKPPRLSYGWDHHSLRQHMASLWCATPSASSTAVFLYKKFTQRVRSYLISLNRNRKAKELTLARNILLYTLQHLYAAPIYYPPTTSRARSSDFSTGCFVGSRARSQPWEIQKRGHCLFFRTMVTIRLPSVFYAISTFETPRSCHHIASSLSFFPDSTTRRPSLEVSCRGWNISSFPSQ